MQAIGPIPRQRVEISLTIMYAGMDRPWSALLEMIERTNCCSYRQVERAFQLYETTPAHELRKIRADAAAAQLVRSRAVGFKLIAVALRVGYRDDRMLRREIRRTWGMCPKDLRRAAKLHRTLSTWDEVRKERLSRALEYQKRAVSHRAWREQKSMRKELAYLLKSAPPATRRLISRRLEIRTAHEASTHASEAAREHLQRLNEEHRLRLLREAA